MGQYHKILNLDRQEFIDPSLLGDGLKLGEFASGHQSASMAALGILLAASAGRGMGDIVDRDDPDYHGEANPQRAYVGRWAGEGIIIAGDYMEDSDMPDLDHASQLYDACHGRSKCRGKHDAWPCFTDISDEVIPLVERMAGFQIRKDVFRDQVHTEKVRSYSTDATYDVEYGTRGVYSCSCPDFLHRRRGCKHMESVSAREHLPITVAAPPMERV